MNGDGQKSNESISIHTPHAGSDPVRHQRRFAQIDFNPHSPCGERRQDTVKHSRPARISIHTPHAGSDGLVMEAGEPVPISIHTPHAGSDSPSARYTNGREISIHTPHAGSDWQNVTPAPVRRLFQSTLPMRGATDYCNITRYLPLISIHTPHAGSDWIHHPAVH